MMHARNLINLNATGKASGPSALILVPQHDHSLTHVTLYLCSGVYNQTIVKSMGVNLPRLMQSHFQTATIAFKELNGVYDWVIEFTCGGMEEIFKGGFVGVNMYSRSISPANLKEMIAEVKGLGLGWVLEEGFHVPTHNSSICTYNSTVENSKTSTVDTAETGQHSQLTQVPVRSNYVSDILKAAPNPVCLVAHCLPEMIACERDRSMCAAGLTCVMGCTGPNNTMACLYDCLNSYEDTSYSDFTRCSVTDHHCVIPVPPNDQIKSCRKPSAMESFDKSLLQGRWYIPIGLNKVIDCYDCQYGEFKWDAKKESPAGAFFLFKAPMEQGGFRNRTLNETYLDLSPGMFQLQVESDGLDQYQNFTVLDVIRGPGYEDGVILGYWCATNNIGSLNEGINVFTRTYQLPDQAVNALRAAAEKAGFAYDDFCTVDNTHCQYPAAALV